MSIRAAAVTRPWPEPAGSIQTPISQFPASASNRTNITPPTSVPSSQMP